MMQDEDRLREMLRSLAVMPLSDRDYVLDQLSETDAAVVEPYLKRIEARSMSPALQALVNASAKERIPDPLTLRAATALRAAVSQPLSVPDGGSAGPAGQGHWRDRLHTWLAKG